MQKDEILKAKAADKQKPAIFILSFIIKKRINSNKCDSIISQNSTRMKMANQHLKTC